MIVVLDRNPAFVHSLVDVLLGAGREAVGIVVSTVDTVEVVLDEILELNPKIVLVASQRNKRQYKALSGSKFGIQAVRDDFNSEIIRHLQHLHA